MKRIAIVLGLLNLSIVFSQTKIDSLAQVAATTTDDSLKIVTYLKLYFEYHRTDQNRALDYTTKAEELSIKIGSDHGLGRSKFYKGVALLNMGRYVEAEAKYHEALDIFKKIDEKQYSARVKIELARLLQKQSNFDEAIKEYLEAIELVKEIEDKNEEARVYSFLGAIFNSIKQHDKAIEYYKLALSLVKELDYKPGISACLVNLGDTYITTKEYDKAIPYLEESLNLKKEVGDKLGASRVLNSFGLVYSNKKDYTQAYIKYREALKLAREVDNQSQIYRITYALAQNAFDQGKFSEAINLLNLILSDSSYEPSLELASDIRQLLSKSYEKSNNFKEAYKNSKIHSQLKDSLYNDKIVSVINDLEAKYKNIEIKKNNQLLESENNLQALELQKSINERNTYMALLFVLFLIAGMLYYLFQVKQKTTKKLKELDTIKSNFFANISHEFRTPLTLIKGPIEHLQTHPKETLNGKHVDMIQRNVDRLLKLVNQLLDLSAIDQNKLVLNNVEGDIYKYLRVLTSSFQSYAEQDGFNYITTIPSEVFWTSFDQNKIEEILYNLIGNAFKFSDNKATISITVCYKDEKLEISVFNSGKGIDQDKLPYIFDRFYQVKNSEVNSVVGTGIGLSLVKELVTLMKGTITVISGVDKGTTFYVKLPLQKLKVPSEHIEKDSPYHTMVTSNLHTKPLDISENDKRKVPTVLLIEDNVDMSSFIKEHLIKNYKVEVAHDGELGLQRAVDMMPDIIISDVMMPKMDGLQLCEKLKTDINTSHIPIVMLTARSGMENKLTGLKLGADVYLTKPFNIEELLVQTNNLINQRKQLRERYRSNKFSIDPKEVTNTSIDEVFLEKVLNLLEDKFSDPDFGVPQMQSDLGMSKTQLHRKLKALVDEPPGELLRNFRLKKAAQLIERNADNVTQIAYMVGFNNMSYFAKCFKEFHGVSPSSYKKP